MPGPGPGNDEERLPWLAPYRETATAKPAPVPAKKRGAGMLVGGVAALAAALTAGFYVGQHEPQPAAPAAEVALAPTKPAPVAPTITPATPVEAPPKVEAPAPKKIVTASVRKKAWRATKARQRKIRSAGIESARLKAVRAAQERRPSPRPVARAWPKMPSPGPAGQVIQLGAFKNPARAHAAYRMRLARYPLLARMPRVVVPVVTKPRGRILYVLRLGTTSRQQSGIVCRNLRASGDHCLVIG